MTSKLSILGVSGQIGSGKDTVADYACDSYGFVKIALADPIKSFGYDVFTFTKTQLWGPSDARNGIDERYHSEDAWNEAQWRLEMYGHEYIENLLDTTDTVVVAEAFASLVHWFLWLRSKYTGALSPRIMLQTLGTEWGRTLSPDVWVNAMIRSAKKILGEDGSMIPYKYDPAAGPVKLSSRKGFQLPTGVVVSDIRFENEFKRIHEVGGAVMRVIRPDTDGKAATIGISGHASEAQDFDLSNFDFVLNNDRTLQDLYSSVDTYMLIFKNQHEVT